MNIDELDPYALNLSTPYRIDFEPRPDDVPHAPQRYVVLYRHPNHPDKLLVIGSSGGTPGIVDLLLPHPIIRPGQRFSFCWDDVDGQKWGIAGVCARIEAGVADPNRWLCEPLHQQLVWLFR